ncbi:MAG: hypothetical protein ACOYLB_01395 [Phototrophicaceae bacterium]
MAVNDVVWYLQDHIIYVKQTGIVDYTILHQRSQRIIEMVNQSSAMTIHTLVDSQDVTSSPFDLETVYRQLGSYAHSPKIGITVYLGKYNRIRKLAIVMFYKLVNSQLEFADTIEDALVLLMERDAVLQPLLQNYQPTTLLD